MKQGQKYDYQGSKLTLSELHAFATNSIHVEALRMRLKKGWAVHDALTVKVGTPNPGRGPVQASAAKTTRKLVTPKKKAPKNDEDVARAAASRALDDLERKLNGTELLDPVQLLQNLGVAHELLGRTPRGRLVLVLD